MVAEENDKPTVIALREIEEGLIDASILNEVEEEVEEIIPAEASELAVGDTAPPAAEI